MTQPSDFLPIQTYFGDEQYLKILDLLESNNRSNTNILNAMNAITNRLTVIESRQKIMQRHVDALYNTVSEMKGDVDDMNNKIDVLEDNIHIVNDDLEEYINEDLEYENLRSNTMNTNTKVIEKALKTFAHRITNIETQIF